MDTNTFNVDQDPEFWSNWDQDLDPGLGPDPVLYYQF